MYIYGVVFLAHWQTDILDVFDTFFKAAFSCVEQPSDFISNVLLS